MVQSEDERVQVGSLYIVTCKVRYILGLGWISDILLIIYAGYQADYRVSKFCNTIQLGSLRMSV